MLKISAAAVCAAACFASPQAQAQAPVYPTDLTNIAAAANGGRVISSTSTFEENAEWSANNLIDGKVFNSAANSGSPGWSSNKFDPVTMDSVTLGFGEGEIKRIGKIVLNPTSAVPPERWAKDVEIQVSKESPDGPFRSAGIITLRREAKPQSFLIFPVEAKYVRLLFRSNQGSDRAVALGEVEMYEAISVSDPVGQLIASMEQAIGELKQYKELQVRLGNGSVTASELEKAKNTSGQMSEATVQMVQMMMADEKASYPLSKVNIAATANGGKIVDFSSVFNNDPAFSASNLLDGLIFRQGAAPGADSSSGWASQGFTPADEKNQQFVTVGFSDDKPHLIGKIVLNPTSDQAILRWARRVEMQVTNGDAKTGEYRTVGTLALRSNAVNQEFLIQPTEARYVRFVFKSNGPTEMNLKGFSPGVSSDRSVSLGEIEIYEATSANDALDAIIGRFTTILDGLKRLPRGKNAANASAAQATKAAAQTS